MKRPNFEKVGYTNNEPTWPGTGLLQSVWKCGKTSFEANRREGEGGGGGGF